ncbi:MAG: hypothetical protein KIS76_06570 [Pyrinomonadaceae bacterium]|nr:hypothetical protein [Pyrinomonadaceae bacterium]
MARKLTIREIHAETGAAIVTLSRWCRIGKFPNGEKVVSPACEFWLKPEKDFTNVRDELADLKRGRPKAD